MVLSPKSLECLREMINQKTTYRSGPVLVEFFNRLGFNESYSWNGGFPSRWAYTDEKLNAINGRPELDRCIKMVFNPAEFIGRLDVLRSCLAEFNEYLAFDGWVVEVKNTGVEIHWVKGPDIEAKLKEQTTTDGAETEADFLSLEIEDIDMTRLPVDEVLKPIIETRMAEMKSCFKVKAYLSVIFMAGSMLEGILLSIANQNSRLYNMAPSAPKNKESKVKAFHEWRLADLISVSCEIGYLKKDVAKFSHVLREFRNYIHPYQQMSERFFPDENTAKICIQVMKGALLQISSFKA